MSTGMTFDEVLDQLDFPSLDGFARYWKSYPPIHIMVADYFGIEPQKRPTDKPRVMDEASITELMGIFPQTPAT